METSATAKDHDVTTEYDRGDQTLHDTAEERAFGAQLLPALYSAVFVVGLIGNILVVLVHCSQLDLAIEVTEVIAYAHCCVNPIVYVSSPGRYHRALWDLLYQLTICRCFIHKETGEGSPHVHFTGEEESCSVVHPGPNNRHQPRC